MVLNKLIYDLFGYQSKEINFILASNSPRRAQLLSNLGINFRVISPEFDEQGINVSLWEPSKIVKFFSEQKAKSVGAKYPEDIIISADTLVFKGAKILGKPKDIDEARYMLKFIQDGPHKVLTGVCLYNYAKKLLLSDFEETTVWVDKMGEKEIKWYLSTGESLDKAGGYGIQGHFSLFIKKIEGCYFNVVGFPINLFFRLLKNYLKIFFRIEQIET